MAGPESEHIYGVQLRESADDGSDFSNADADYRVVFLGEDGFLHAKDSSGTVSDPYDVSGGSNVGNLWTMSKSSSQTLTSATLTQITFDVAHIDGGGSVIDLANERFVAPATGLYMAYATWLWETTPPQNVASVNMSVKVGSVEQAAIVRLQGVAAANGGLHGSWPLSLSSGDFVTLWIHPQTATPTARGNASPNLATTFTLLRIT